MKSNFSLLIHVPRNSESAKQVIFYKDFLLLLGALLVLMRNVELTLLWNKALGLFPH